MGNKCIDKAPIEADQYLQTGYHDAWRIRDIRQLNEAIEIRLEWACLPDDCDLTWEPLQNVLQDLPGHLQDYFVTPRELELRNKVRDMCGSDK